MTDPGIIGFWPYPVISVILGYPIFRGVPDKQVAKMVIFVYIGVGYPSRMCPKVGQNDRFWVTKVVKKGVRVPVKK
jgi:hypothetical protein